MCVVVFFKNVVQFGLHSRTALRQLRLKNLLLRLFFNQLSRWYKVQQADTQQLLGVVGLKQVSSSFCCSSTSIECSLARSVQKKLKSRRRDEPYMYGESTVQPTKLFSRQRNKKNVYALSARDYISAKTAMRHLSEKRRFEGRNK
jgi:hypothetical protein